MATALNTCWEALARQVIYLCEGCVPKLSHMFCIISWQTRFGFSCIFWCHVDQLWQTHFQALFLGPWTTITLLFSSENYFELLCICRPTFHWNNSVTSLPSIFLHFVCRGKGLDIPAVNCLSVWIWVVWLPVQGVPRLSAKVNLDSHDVGSLRGQSMDPVCSANKTEVILLAKKKTGVTVWVTVFKNQRPSLKKNNNKNIQTEGLHAQSRPG